MKEDAPIESGFLNRANRGYNTANHVAKTVTTGTFHIAKEIVLGIIGLNPPGTVRIDDAIETENGGICFVRVPAGEAFREASEGKTPIASEDTIVFIGPVIPNGLLTPDQGP